jgi:WD40 repeat protein
VLVCNDLDEGSQSELSEAIPLEPKSVGMLEGPPEAEITTICCHPSGDFVFCGKQDGSVAYFETRTATQNGILYRHAAKIGITCIAYIEERCLLVTADESGRVLINSLKVSQAGCEVAGLIAEIRSEKSLITLLPDTSGTRILIRSKTSAEVWTMEGEKVGLTILFHDDDVSTIINHPLYAEQFISIGRKDMRIYSWADALETQPFFDGKTKALSLTVTTPSAAYHRGLQPEDWTNLSTYQQSSQFIVNLLKGSPFSTSCSASSALQVWPASSISAFNPFARPIPILGFDNHAHRVRQIIGVTGSLILFLDTDLWVCSLDMTKVTSLTHGVKRHFFLLSEWQSSDRGFIVEYAPARREFLVARKHGVLVVSRGLEFEEPWFAS